MSKLTIEHRQKISAAMKKVVRTEEHRRNISRSKLGKKNGMWKGANTGYMALHAWIRTHWGQPRYCEHCKTIEAKMYDWANVTGIYNRVRKNWKRLCRGCHIKFDRYRSITL